MLLSINMTTTKRKNSDGNIWQSLKNMDIVKLVFNSRNNSNLLSVLRSEVGVVATTLNFQKIDTIFKLIYKLFLYSVIGIFAKFIIKFLKF